MIHTPASSGLTPGPALSGVASNSPTLEETMSLAPDVRQLLLRTVWGTPKHGALYKIADLGFFGNFPSLDFHNLRDANYRLLASRFFRAHPIRIGGHKVNAMYHSFSAVPADLQGRGFGGQLAAASRDSLIRKLGKNGGIIYAYVERANIRNARNLQKAGYEAVGEFWTGCMADAAPRLSADVRPLTARDLVQVRDLYAASYADFAFVDAGETFAGHGHYVLERNGEIMAMLHAEPLHWRIERLGFPGDRLILSLMSRAPAVRKIFNAADLRFLKMGHLCYRHGQIGKLRELTLGVLALHQKNTALFYVDKKAPLFKESKSSGILGWLNMLTETPVTIYAHFANIPISLQHEFRSRLKTFSPHNL
jgi:ribosomal protein S18 acetylase RimI-like enzyme